LLLVVASGGKCKAEVKHVSLVVKEVANPLDYVAWYVGLAVEGETPSLLHSQKVFHLNLLGVGSCPA
jgi:hypothetical protein